ncbi:hypothetical protein [Limnohabitans sp.]|jgi:cation transport ATPase|uniref:hypothetical protein n=1 Tax=Limnohabitans sp. TaxID=1907725 RepID=UPI00286EFC87|nr:hypothetical protein [Limnohabitans sp.]
MQCVYCLSAVDDKANVCKVCTRDLYLFRPLLEKVKELETKLAEHQDPVELQARVDELEALLVAERSRMDKKEATPWRLITDVGQFIFIPLALLLLAHALIVVIYDINMLYLRIASVALPLPFAFYLFKTQKRSLLGWFIATAFLAASSVIGMSAITAWVDHTPILPQSMIEWREFLEYAASITLSFLTGMLLGGVAYHRAHRVVKKKDGPFLSALVSKFSNGSTSPMDMHEKIQKIEEIGGSLIAAGTTAMSIYTGLKDYL